MDLSFIAKKLKIMETTYYEIAVIIVGIIQLILILLFVFLFINVKSILKENEKQTLVLLSIADKQGTLIKKKCPYCEKEIIITTLLTDKSECENCGGYFQIENDTLVKISKP